MKMVPQTWYAGRGSVGSLRRAIRQVIRVGKRRERTKKGLGFDIYQLRRFFVARVIDIRVRSR